MVDYNIEERSFADGRWSIKRVAANSSFSASTAEEEFLGLITKAANVYLETLSEQVTASIERRRSEHGQGDPEPWAVIYDEAEEWASILTLWSDHRNAAEPYRPTLRSYETNLRLMDVHRLTGGWVMYSYEITEHLWYDVRVHYPELVDACMPDLPEEPLPR